MSSTVSAPNPRPDADSASFWQGLGDGRLLLQRCSTCDRFRFPPMPSCPYCGAPAWNEVASAGRGRVYSWVRVHVALTPAVKDDVPYTIAVVELDEGPRVVGRIDGHEGVAIGDPVTAAFANRGDWTELRFVSQASETKRSEPAGSLAGNPSAATGTTPPSHSLERESTDEQPRPGRLGVVFRQTPR
ncbi:MAG: Zn-ribbon domain-containing OB-fold protein [Chloroflexota bacterium]|nr:Zn-ribbon domain-containing OB-fold protein [Chloroflexota bacterium]